MAEFLQRLQTVVQPTQRVVVLVDCPTSKVSINHAMLDHVCLVRAQLEKQIPLDNVVITVMCGHRLPLASGNSVKMGTWGFNVFLVQLIKWEIQSVTRRPSFALVASRGKRGPQASFQLPCRTAKPGECLRLRCRNPDCAFRSEAERAHIADWRAQNAPEPATDQEIDANDREDDGQGHEMEDGDEGAGDDGGQAEEAAIMAALEAIPGGGDLASSDTKPYLVDLWPHSASAATYKSLFRIMAAEQPPPNHVVVFTSSAHPAPALAASQLGAECDIVFTPGNQTFP